jgi:fructose-bisphosphate aldolase class II
MGITDLSTQLRRAAIHGYAIGYFEAWDTYSLEAVLEAAEETASPAILGFGGAVANQAWLDRWGVEELASLARRLAEASRVPASVLFNEARTLDQVARGLRAGCTAVMLDTSHLPFEENAVLTRRVVELAHAAGAAVEAELGHLADATDPGHAAEPTDPDEAARFVERTGVDALAVSVGNVHILSDGEAEVDLEALARIHRAVPVPLVIHGGTGFPSRAVPAAISLGVAKFNVGTRLKQAYLDGARQAIAGVPGRPNVHRVIGSRDPSDILLPAKAGVKEQVSALMRLYGSAGKALEA